METYQKKEIILPLCFYQQSNVVSIGKALLGKYLFTNINDTITGGMIVETESYAGVEDRASHAYGGRYTQRTKTMYEEGGIAYIYLCYGIHHLLNVVTNSKGVPHAILIRAIEPLCGTDTMLKRRKKQKLERSLTAGPGALSQALGLTLEHNGLPLQSSKIWIADRGVKLKKNHIFVSKRIGIGYAKEDRHLLWRFRIHKNPWTSRVEASY